MSSSLFLSAKLYNYMLCIDVKEYFFSGSRSYWCTCEQRWAFVFHRCSAVMSSLFCAVLKTTILWWIQYYQTDNWLLKNLALTIKAVFSLLLWNSRTVFLSSGIDWIIGCVANKMEVDLNGYFIGKKGFPDVKVLSFGLWWWHQRKLWLWSSAYFDAFIYSVCQEQMWLKT